MKNTVLLFLTLLCSLSRAFSQSDSLQGAPLFSSLQVVNFDATVVSKNVLLQWRVSNNEEARSYEVERAEEGGTYKKVGSKLATARSGKADYEFVDALPRKNVGLTYHIKIIARDGSFVYSVVQDSRIEDAVLQCKLKQNPVHQAVEVEITSPKAGMMQAAVFTAYGQKIISETTKLSAGTNLLSLSSQNLLPGLHRLVLESGNERKVISFVKE